MRTKKYDKTLFIISIYYVLVLSLLAYAYSSEKLQLQFNHGNYLTWLLPIHNIWAQIMLIFLVFVPFSALIGSLLGGYLLAPVFLFIQKKFLGLKMLYGIQEKSQTQDFDKLSRGWFPSLLAINMNFIFLFSAPRLIEQIVYLKFRDGPIYSALYIPGFIVLLMFTMGLGTLVFSPTWFLIDAGIVYSNKEKVSRSDQPVEARTVGGRFTDYLRGYTGIGVVLSYLQFLHYFYVEKLFSLSKLGQIVVLAFFFGFPVFMMVASAPSLIILDMIKDHRIHYIRTIAKKMGITDYVKISFEKIRD